MPKQLEASYQGMLFPNVFEAVQELSLLKQALLTDAYLRELRVDAHALSLPPGISQIVIAFYKKESGLSYPILFNHPQQDI